ncbi:MULTISPECIES: SMI1/KNR4 family protein [Pseudomonas]|uniref:SMI1/KNR4 family protein n=1 Tax=Pseudomonas quercus TaxID=2722792 RepID=A0ABX0YDY7_9PSED|nr:MULTISPECIES: SMI1/KNR4 family protein [Pseudomonas]MBF7142713.1 SMI1/KNR4 family protein [Pseudomonas sp. LY10J]NJP01251.1 SMI1/KNR4 family protein [Pseudomonas quercus]
MQILKSDVKIGLAEIRFFEDAIGYCLPEAFRNFYLKNNGGLPSKDWWDGSDEYDAVRVKKFKPLAGSRHVEEHNTAFIENCYLAMVKRNVIPKTLLPFAIDDGGNLFCLDLIEGNVCYYTIDSFDSDASIAVNQARACRWLEKSFQEFIENLKDEDDIGY